MERFDKFQRWKLMKMLLILATVVAVTLAQPSSVQPSPAAPTVRIRQGMLQGTIATYRNGQQYQAFRGIPYAKPPIGDLRLAKPVPHPGFQGVFDASQYGPSCMQGQLGSQVFDANQSSEDCLTLNVFVPLSSDGSAATQENTGSKNGSYPVMIFIHGGAFIIGNAMSYEGGKLVTEGDIIVVTVQYRLGIMGFLSTGDPTLPGNYGLWDQNMAIRWVKDNIAAFGGDPDDITVSGESAGSASVSYQSLSPHSKDLFQKGIQYSGTATSSWALTRNPRHHSSAVAQKLGCTLPPLVQSVDQDVMVMRHDFLECLRKASLENLLTAGIFNRSRAWQILDFVFVPCVDGDFVPDEPHNMLKDAQYLQQIGFYDRDYLSGVLNNEGALLFEIAAIYLGDALAAVLGDPDFFDQELAEAFLIQRFGDTNPTLESAMSFFYTYPRFPNVPMVDMGGLMKAEADVGFYVPLLEFARAVATSKHQDKRNLVYYFDYYPKFMTGALQGIPHGLDMTYLFDSDKEAGLAFTGGNASLWNADDDWMAEAYRSITLDFVKSSVPVTGLRPEFTGDWIDFEIVNESYLSLSPHNATVQRHLHARRASFWLDFLPKLRSISRNGTADFQHTEQAFLQSPIIG